MKKAIDLAKTNPAAPFGAVLVDRRTGLIVSQGVNQSSQNPTLHGEIAAINDYVRQNGTDWQELTLYTSAEPCCMCQGAVLWAGITEVVYGTSIAQLRQLGWKQIDIPSQEVVARSWDPTVSILGGVCADECDRLFRDAVKTRES
jgi:tRNA(Arg) A34 adenosine deaminase TadA